jgi:hypothetical protein
MISKYDNRGIIEILEDRIKVLEERVVDQAHQIQTLQKEKANRIAMKDIASQLETKLTTMTKDIPYQMKKFEQERERVVVRDCLIDINVYRLARGATRESLIKMSETNPGVFEFWKEEEKLLKFEKLRLQNETIQHTLQSLVKTFKDVSE